MEGGNDKRCITGTFSITFTNEFLPVQLIYGGKTVKSLPRFKFPQEFSLSANPIHFSNWSESTKLFEEVIILYFQKEQKKLNLSSIHNGLIIMDVFKGKIASEVFMILNYNNICLANIPPSMTKYYQPLYLTVNGHAIRYLKNKFSGWNWNQISKKLEEDVNIDAMDVKLHLTILKPLHAQ